MRAGAHSVAAEAIAENGHLRTVREPHHLAEVRSTDTWYSTRCARSGERPEIAYLAGPHTVLHAAIIGSDSGR
ncbi:hypothetical protein IWGMT90018_06550 [Mycobacterium kiyosense]|nr:hypothetical protein IWGMT90018_06550 [Mycobacterium kiyosense]